MSNSALKHRGPWEDLQKHQAAMENVHMRDLFAADEQRFDQFHLRLGGLLLDYSKHRITAETMELLCALAEAQDVAGMRTQMFAGAPINTTEERAVMHTALRSASGQKEIDEAVKAMQKRMREISDAVRGDKDITDVVSIGIGGSDLGPRMVCSALAHRHDGPRVHFVSNIDGDSLGDALKNLKPETTMFIIVSKTFTTLETLSNAAAAKAWCGGKTKGRFIAVTANTAAAKEFGVDEEHILPLWDWVGGRYSLWSAVGLSIALSAGFEKFKDLLAGAAAMDEHFCTAPLKRNMPVIMALLGVWYRNFWDFRAHAILPYARRLHFLPDFLQQLDMESNGKNVSRDGQELEHATGPIVFGGVGTNAQHAFFQLLHQGTHIVPCDFLMVAEAQHDLPGHHIKLNANAIAQAQALMQGSEEDVPPHRRFSGNRPSSTLLLERLDPYHLGMLLALYEHKVFVQGILWNINSFDQWGVELGKTMAKDAISFLEGQTENAGSDSSTRALLSHIKSYVKNKS